MPATSPAQQRLFGMVDAYQKGELHTKPSAEIKHLAHSMTHKQVHDFAATKGLAAGGLPHSRIKLDTGVVPHAGPKAPGFASTPYKVPKPQGLSPSTWEERTEARGLYSGRGLAAGGSAGNDNIDILDGLARCGMQMGGMMGAEPWMERSEADQEIEMPHGGFLNSSIAGRTDRLPVVTGADSFVVPAAEVSGIGQGNSLNGARMLKAALRSGPYGTDLARAMHAHTIPRPPSIPGDERREIEPESAGGHAHDGGQRSHVLVAGGEFIIPPHDWVEHDPTTGEAHVYRGVRSLGGGDIEKGQEILRNMVGKIREHTVKTLRRLPPPKRSAGGYVGLAMAA